MLKPAGFADYDILFGQGGMVLAYTTSSKNAATITAPGGVFNPPESVLAVADDWYMQLMQPGVAIGGSHPLSRSERLPRRPDLSAADQLYQLPNLYDLLLEHYSVIKATDALGKTYDYQFIYEHSALAAYNADATKSYRYAKLPDQVGLSNPQLNRRYRKAAITIPGLGLPDTDTTVSIPATRVVWGLTVLKSAANRDNARIVTWIAGRLGGCSVLSSSNRRATSANRLARTRFSCSIDSSTVRSGSSAIASRTAQHILMRAERSSVASSLAARRSQRSSVPID